MRIRIKNIRQLALITSVFLLIFADKAFSQAASVTLADATAGTGTQYTINFTLAPLDALPNNGSISLTFNAGFTLGATMSITSGDIDGGWNSPSPVGQTITFVRDGTGTALTGGNSYTIVVQTVTNHQTTGSYNLQFTTSGSEPFHTDVTSSNFTITAAALGSFTISGEPASAVAGVAFSTPANDIIVNAFDIFGNSKTDYAGTVTWSSSDGSASFPTSGLTFSGASKTFTGSDFTLRTTTSQTFTVTDGAVNQASAAITVTPAALGSFTISGEPASAVAGVAFSTPANDIVVNAFDIFGNSKTDYAGTVTWSSSDGSASFPTSGLTFSGASKTFTGSDFTLRTTTSQTFTVTDGAVNRASAAITVTPAALGSFTISGEPASAVAGVAFSTPANDIVVNAFDIFGNSKTNYTGTVTWTSSDGSASFPTSGLTFSGASKTFTGSDFTLRTTTSQTFTVTDGAVNRASAAITVTPAALGSFTISGEPASAVAGVAFSTPANDIIVNAFDIFGNSKTDYAGTVTWSSSDGSASFPTSGLTFSGASKTFTGSDFTLRTTTSQTFTVTDGAVNQASAAITVTPAALGSFTISGEPASAVAGVAFSTPANDIIVNAFDIFGNSKTDYAGTVTWSSSDGSASFPTSSLTFSGASKTFTGSDFVLRTAPSQTFTVTDGAVNQASAAITVTPAALGSFTISGEPASAVAGVAFSTPANDIIVNAFDIFGNSKTDYAGTVTWSSSDGSASFPTSDLTFSGASKTFTGSDFVLRTAPSQTFTVTDGAVNQTTAAITVGSAALGSFTISGEPATTVAGVAFSSPANDIVVTAYDIFNNPKTDYTGTVTWTSSDGSASFPTSGLTFSGASKTFTGSDFTLRTTTSQTFTVTDGAVNQTSAAITVTPAALGSFTISGEPASTVAGVAFPTPANDIVVTAYDIFNNLKTDYAGTVTWTSSDVLASFPTSGLTFSGAAKTFTGSDFTLRTIPTQTFTLTDGGVNQITSGITVTAAAIASFTLSDPADQEAGVDFSLDVSGAVDAFGNAASGIVTVSFQDGGTHQVPNGESPTLSDITVTAGTGAANQQLVLRETGVIFRGDIGAANDVTTEFAVQAGAIENFTLTLAPGQITAGQAFTLFVENARDGFNNIADGTVNISFQDAGAHLSPNSDSPSLNNITVTSGAGNANQTLFLAESNVVLLGTSAAAPNPTDATESFTVVADDLNSFTIDNIASPQTAGSAFSVSISDAEDAYGNPTSGTNIAMSFTDAGTHLAPNSIPPTLQNISITNGSGSASQTLVRAESVQLRGTGNGQIVDSNIFTVNSGSFTSIAVYSGLNGQTSAVNATTLNLSDQLPVHAVGFDIYQNFTDGLSVNWSVLGTPTIGTLSDATGASTTLTADTPGSGQISALHVASGLSNQTGLITVQSTGTIDSIVIRDAPNNGGSAVGDLPSVSADDVITFYAAGYEAGVFIGDVPVNWSAQSGTLAPTISANNQSSYQFSPTTAPASGVILAQHVASGSSDVTGTITVSPGALVQVKVLQAGVGNTGEIPDQSIQPGTEIDVKASGFDGDDNYRSEESVSWSTVPSALGSTLPSSGTNSTFTAVKAGEVGQIKADHLTAIDGFSGTITVQTGTVDSVDIRTAANNGGTSVTTLDLSSDDIITLYAAGYDVLNQYVDDVTVTWRSIGTIDTVDSVTETGPSLTFDPRWAPRTGQLVADHTTARDDTTGLVTVSTGAPVTVITLTPAPDVLQANGVEFSDVTSNALSDADGNLVGSGKEFDIQLLNPVLGSLTDDTNGSRGGAQDTTNASSQLEFRFTAGTQAGTQNIVVNSLDSDLSGQTSITLGSLRIVSIGNAPEFVSRGQQNIMGVQMVVQNLTPTEVTGVTPILTFNSGTATGFNQTKTDAFTTIPASPGSRTFTFEVDVAGNATLGQIGIDGQIDGFIGGQPVSVTGAQNTDTMTVQLPAQIAILSVNTAPDTVAQGNEDIDVTVRLRNNASSGSASAVVDDISLKYLFQGSGDSASFFPTTPDGANPVSVKAGEEEDFVFEVDIGASAPIGAYTLDAEVAAHDTNSTDLTLTDNGAATTDSWYVKAASNLQIVSLTPSVPAVRSGQQDPNWTVTMEVSNNGADPININLAQTFIEFFIAATPVTSEYTIIPPTQFVNSGGSSLDDGETDFLVFTIDETGTSVGQARIRGTINGTDTGTNNPISDNTNDGGEGEVSINSADDKVVITNTNPSPSVPNREPRRGIVNTNQVFNIRVEVSNELQEPIEDVMLRMATRGSSIITSANAIIDSIGPKDEETIDFEVTASASDTTTEIFDVELLSALGTISEQPALIGDPDDDDDEVDFVIQTPADLSMSLEVEEFQTASDTFEVTATVENLGQGSIDASGRLTLTMPTAYTLYTDDGGASNPAQFTDKSDVVWEVIAPNNDTENDTFIVAITQDPIAANTGNPAFISVRADTQIIETQAAGITIDAFEIIEPDGATDDTLSTQQPFTIEAKALISSSIDAVRATLTPAAGYGTPLVQNIDTPGPVPDVTVQWVLNAPDEPHLTSREFYIEMQAIDDGDPRDTKRDTLDVVAVQRAEMSFAYFRIRELDINQFDQYTVSQGQSFTLVARINNEGSAAVEGPGRVRLDLGNTGIATTDSLEQDYTPGTEVAWNVVAPADSNTLLKTISLTLPSQGGVPNDENTNETAFIPGSQRTRTIQIEIGDFGSVTIDSLEIVTPGAFNRVLSTEQSFTISAEITWQNAQNVRATLNFPSGAGYDVAPGENRIKNNINGGIPDGTTDERWTIIAPSSVTGPLFLNFLVEGTDENDENRELDSARDSLSFTVVEKAVLSLSAGISAPESARDSLVTEGQEFTVTAQYRKSGTASTIGQDTLRIILPSGYDFANIGESEEKSISSTGSVSWLVKAPDNFHDNPRFITVESPEIKRAIIDENTQDLPPLSPASRTFPITTRAIALIAEVLTGEQFPSTIPRGATNQPILALRFENPSDADIVVTQFNFTVRDAVGDIAPNAVLSGMRVVDYLDPSNVLGALNSMQAMNPVTFDFNNEITVSPNGGENAVEFQVSLLSQTDISNFQIELTNPSRRDIIARVVNADTVDITNDEGTELRDNALTRGISTVTEASLEGSFFNFPNPFGTGGQGSTSFNFNIDQTSDISIKIYTLLGRLVKKIERQNVLPGNYYNLLTWDGTNGDGQLVINGVYIAILTTNSGTAVTKIAVAR